MAFLVLTLVVLSVLGFALSLQARERIRALEARIKTLEADREATPAQAATPAASVPAPPIPPVVAKVRPAPKVPVALAPRDPEPASPPPAPHPRAADPITAKAGGLDFIFRHVAGVAGALLALVGLGWLAWLGIFALGPAWRFAVIYGLGWLILGAGSLGPLGRPSSAPGTWLRSLGGGSLLVAALGAGAIPGMAFLPSGAPLHYVFVGLALGANALVPWRHSGTLPSLIHALFSFVALALVPADLLSLGAGAALALGSLGLAWKQRRPGLLAGILALTLAWLVAWTVQYHSGPGGAPLALALLGLVAQAAWAVVLSPSWRPLFQGRSLGGPAALLALGQAVALLLLFEARTWYSPLLAVQALGFMIQRQRLLTPGPSSNRALTDLGAGLSLASLAAAVLSLLAWYSTGALLVPGLWGLLGFTWGILSRRGTLPRFLYPWALALEWAGIGLLALNLGTHWSWSSPLEPLDPKLLLTLIPLLTLVVRNRLVREPRGPKLVHGLMAAIHLAVAVGYTAYQEPWLTGPALALIPAMVAWVHRQVKLAHDPLGPGHRARRFLDTSLTAVAGLTALTALVVLGLGDHQGETGPSLVLAVLALVQAPLWLPKDGTSGHRNTRIRGWIALVWSLGAGILAFWVVTAVPLPWLGGPLILSAWALYRLLCRRSGSPLPSTGGLAWLLLFWAHHGLVQLQNEHFIALPGDFLLSQRLLVGLPGIMAMLWSGFQEGHQRRAQRAWLLAAFAATVYLVVVDSSPAWLALVFVILALGVAFGRRWIWPHPDEVLPAALGFYLLGLASLASLGSSLAWPVDGLPAEGTWAALGAMVLLVASSAHLLVLGRHHRKGPWWDRILILPLCLTLGWYLWWAVDPAWVNLAWLTLALGLFILGLGLAEPWFYGGSLILLASIMGKLILVDLQEAPTYGRVLLFLLTGVVLMAMSILYRRFAPRPGEGHGPTSAPEPQGPQPRAATLVALVGAALGLAALVWTALSPGPVRFLRAWSPVFRAGGTASLMVQSLATRILVPDRMAEADWARVWRENQEPPLRRPEQAYVEEVLASLVARHGTKDLVWEAQVVDAPEANAWAVAGGTIMVSLGLLEVLETEAQLAAILLHEMAHVERGHCLGLVRAEVARRGKDRFGPREALDIMLSMTFRLGFSQAQEEEADAWAFDALRASGYHPEGLGRAFLALEAVYRWASPPPGAEESIYDAYQQSHPDLALRRAQWLGRAEALSGPRQWLVGRLRYRLQDHRFPEDRSEAWDPLAIED